MIFGIKTASTIARECGCTADEVKAELRALWEAEEYDKRKFYGTLGIMVLVCISFALGYGISARYLDLSMVYFYFGVALIVFVFTQFAIYGSAESKIKERLGKKQNESD